MSGPSSTLNRYMRAKVHVVLKRSCNIPINNCSGQWITILVGVGAGREEADVVTLLSDDDCEFGLYKITIALKMY